MTNEENLRALLAEPVETPLDFVARMQRERDDARAEVERLRGTWKWDAIKAYKRGAEAMREAAARLVDEMLSHTLTDAADRIRDLTIPEDEP